ncbi:MAG TPA: ABC transporter permease [Acidimicrobiales bacterium]|nr:ABC transporter permease [Acidimicrobiales bacterium]
MLDPARLASVADPWVRWDWVRSHGDDIGAAARQHVELTAWAIGLGIAISAPLALAVVRWRRLWPPVLAVTGVVYTIPSLALLALLVPYTGLSRTTALIALVGYTLLILVRNTVAGLDGVPADVREAAQAMGYTRRAQLVRVELPLAVPTIVAGVRIATVTTICLVTVTAVIGQGGLGAFILEGLVRDFRTPLVVGSVLSVVLAVAADLALLGVERLVTPWSRRERS